MVLCVIIYLLCPVMALDQARITSIGGLIRIMPDLFSEEELVITYEGISGTVLGDEFRLPGEISSLKVRDVEGSLDFSKKTSGGITTVRYIFRRGLRPGGENTVTISYRSANFTSKSGDVWGYSTLLMAGSKVGQWGVILELPSEVELYMPDGDAIESLRRIAREGGKTVCEWSREKSDQLALAIGYSPLQEESGSRLTLYLAIAGVLMVAGVAGYLLRGLAPDEKVPKAVELAIKLLEDRERRIVRELSGGQSLTQAELVKATKLSKATVSRAVVELERRKVVNRERSGRVIRVSLQDWILET